MIAYLAVTVKGMLQRVLADGVVTLVLAAEAGYEHKETA